MSIHLEKLKEEPTDDISDINLHPWKLKKKIEASTRGLSKQLNEIKSLKVTNTELIKNAKNIEEVSHLFYIREIYDGFIEQLKDGVESATLLLEFMALANIYKKQVADFNEEAKKLRDNINVCSKTYLQSSQKYSKLCIMHVACEEQTECMIFALFILDEFHLFKEKYEDSLWKIALGNNTETVFILLPQDLLELKWLCNQPKEDVSLFSDFLNGYCERNSDNKKLVINMCFVAYKFFECSNFRSSSYILDLSMEILREKKTDSKERYYYFSLCKGLLLMKQREYDGGVKILLEGVRYLTNKFGIDFEKDILIAIEFMNIASVFINYEFYEIGINTLETSVTYLEKYLPYSHELWMEAVDLLGRCYNDTFDFTISLVTVAPAFDYFHILNFGSIKLENKPVYELAIEMGDKGLVQKLSRQLKYAGYLPLGVTLLLSEMMVSFSGLGDQTSVLVIKNWIDRCEILSRGHKRLVIENFEYYDLLDMDRVVKKMRKNRVRHEPLFNHLVTKDLTESHNTI